MARSVAVDAVIPIEAALLAVAIFIASGRLLPRLLQQQRLTVSDGFLIVSILDAIGLFITDTLTYKWGGMSGDSLDESEEGIKRLIALKKVQFAGNAFYDTGIYFPKIAVLALYFKLFPPTMPRLRKVLYAVSCFTVCAMLATFFLDTFWCGSQVSVNWSSDMDACNTFDSTAVFRIDWALNIAADVFIFLLPFPLLKELQLDRRQIWGLVATFSLGAITICMSTVRFVTIEVIFAWTNVYIFSMAEMATAIMVVSLPAMRSFLRRGSIFSSNKKSTSSSSRGYGLRTPATASSRFASIKSKQNTSVQLPDDSGSEVELNYIGRTDVIFETRRLSVQFSKSEHDSEK